MSDSRLAKPLASKVLAAFAAVYVLWGSTYLGIFFASETLPPFLTQGVRYALAGVVMYVWARWRGAPRPTRREWGGSAITGGLLFLVGTGAVVWAEGFIPSGVAALVVATEPMSFVLMEAMRRRRMPRDLSSPASLWASWVSRSSWAPARFWEVNGSTSAPWRCSSWPPSPGPADPFFPAARGCRHPP